LYHLPYQLSELSAFLPRWCGSLQHGGGN
jgi:hypothetical protein